MSIARGTFAVLLVGVFSSLASAQPTSVGGIALVDTVAKVSTQSVETPFVGTFEMSGGCKGTLVIARKGDTLTLSGKANDISFLEMHPLADGTTWKLLLGSTSSGVVNNLGGSAATPHDSNSTRILVVSDAGKGALRGSFEFKGKKAAVSFTRKKFALVLYGTYESGMKDYAVQCRTYYKAKGYNVTFVPGSWDGAVSTLVGAEEQGTPYQRVVIVSHGGWDGPMFREGNFTQISPAMHAISFGDFVRAVKRGTTLDAKIIVSACHAGGSNRYETYRTDFRYTDLVARDTGRMAYGPNGSTSTQWSLELCKFAEGEGPARHESRVSGPGGGKTVKGGSYAGNVPPPITNQPLGTN